MADEGEDVVTCAIRETFEETGLQTSNLIPFGFTSNPKTAIYTYPNGDVCHCFAMLFTTRTFAGIPIDDGRETLGLDWYEPHSLPEVLPATALAIGAFLRWKATGLFQLI